MDAQQQTVSKTVMKKKKSVLSDRLRKGSLKRALVLGLKAEGGREDLKVEEANESHAKLMAAIPITERAGYPVVREEGSLDPADWQTINGVKIAVDFDRHTWLPDTWGQGVKTTMRTKANKTGNGGILICIVAPDGKVFYHQKRAEEYAGFKFSSQNSLKGAFRAAWKQSEQLRQSNASEESFFALLTEEERNMLPAASEFHFGIVSARRAKNAEGVKDIASVQSALVNAGVTPTWYVDADSQQDYQDLGLTAVVGGKLTPARNMALDDAAKLGKVCVQVSDDIAAWEFRHGPRAESKDDNAMNAAWANATSYRISPVAAARFILAKMRAKPNPPKLGGVYMLSTCSRTFGGPEENSYGFCIGDFFVAEVSSVRFDETMTLKEDYDFTCSHIHNDGSVLRLNRMTLNVKHYSNVGGAVDNRDAQGEKERRNIDILNKKWPRCFRKNPKRANEVILNWKPLDGKTLDNGDADDDDTAVDTADISVAPAPPGSSKPAAATKRKGVKKTISAIRPAKAKLTSTAAEVTKDPPLVKVPEAHVSEEATEAMSTNTPQTQVHATTQDTEGLGIEQAPGSSSSKPVAKAKRKYTKKPSPQPAEQTTTEPARIEEDDATPPETHDMKEAAALAPTPEGKAHSCGPDSSSPPAVASKRTLGKKGVDANTPEPKKKKPSEPDSSSKQNVAPKMKKTLTKDTSAVLAQPYVATEAGARTTGITFGMGAMLTKTDKVSESVEVSKRQATVSGMSLGDALNVPCYSLGDLLYDVQAGFLAIN